MFIPDLVSCVRQASASPLIFILQKVRLPDRIELLHVWGFSHLWQEFFIFKLFVWRIELFMAHQNNYFGTKIPSSQLWVLIPKYILLVALGINYPPLVWGNITDMLMGHTIMTIKFLDVVLLFLYVIDFLLGIYHIYSIKIYFKS